MAKFMILLIDSRNAESIIAGKGETMIAAREDARTQHQPDNPVFDSYDEYVAMLQDDGQIVLELDTERELLSEATSFGR